MLLVHGWGADQSQYLASARKIASHRRGPVAPDENLALAACAGFRGDVLPVESERDDITLHPTVVNYR